MLKLISLVGLPALIIATYCSNMSRPGSLVFSCFLLFVVFERVFEALYTSKDKNKNELEGDWTLPVSVMSYIVLVCLCVSEFYINARQSFNVPLIIAALGLYIVAMALRFWAVVSLGDQWSIHIIGKDKLEGKRILLRCGPYKYIRHPVYLGIILEQISIPLAANLYVTFFIAVIFSILFQLLKARFEEKTMRGYFSSQYSEYALQTPGFIPILGTKKVCEKT